MPSMKMDGNSSIMHRVAYMYDHCITHLCPQSWTRENAIDSKNRSIIAVGTKELPADAQGILNDASGSIGNGSAGDEKEKEAEST